MRNFRRLVVYNDGFEITDSSPSRSESSVTFYISPHAEIYQPGDTLKTTLPRLLFNTKDLLMFDYAPNLVVVGTHHALNSEDQTILEESIADVDFVALEGDRESYVTKSFLKRGYVKHERTLYVSPFDYHYLWRFVNSVKEGNADMNKKINERLTADGREERDADLNEFGFCAEMARKYGKDVHLIDPTYRTFKRLLALDIVMKIRHWRYMKDKKKQPSPVRRIIENRESDMLANLENHEGPIDKLERRGLFVVGSAHALRYAWERLNDINAHL